MKKILTYILSNIALLGLIYQIWKDIVSKKANFKLEIRQVKDEYYEEKKYNEIETITVNNVGNREICIVEIGFIKNDSKELLYKINSEDIIDGEKLPFIIKVGEIQIFRINSIVVFIIE